MLFSTDSLILELLRMAFSVRRSLAWMMLSQGGLFVLQFGGSVVIARYLTPYEMGVYAVAYAIVGILNTIRSMGLNVLLVREPELTSDAVKTSFTINAILATVTAAAIASMSVAGGAWLGDSGVKSVLLVLAVSPLLNILELVPIACLERIGSFQVIAALNLMKMAAVTGVSIVLAVYGYSYMSIAWGNLASTILAVICANVIGRRFVSLRFGLHDWRRIAWFGVQCVMIGGMANIAQRVSDLLLGRVVGLSALGLYSRASGLNSMLADNIHAVIARIVFVDFAERHRRSLPLRESYLKIVAMITGLLWPAFTGLAVLAGPVILTVYGPTWIEAAPVLSLLSIAGAVGTSITMTSEIYVVSGETGQLFRTEAKRNAIGLTLFALGCLGGLVWAAAARIGDILGAVFLYKGGIRRMTGTLAMDFAPIYRQSAILTIAACAPAMGLMTINHWSEHTPLSAIFAAVTLGMAAWVVCLWRLRHPLFIEAEHAGRQLFWRYLRSV